ncbi:unnamed protein product [marine sediment metagenome]|uniref:Uncharacterized protein n=1 Tax=marine sediment metagenome TaxID=412755 RepID=X1GK33_9ZZZZ
MTGYKKINELLHLADRAKANGNYTLAEKFIEQLFVEALKSKDAKLITIAAETLLEHRRLHIANVLRDIKRIDPLQSLRKALS